MYGTRWCRVGLESTNAVYRSRSRNGSLTVDATSARLWTMRSRRSWLLEGHPAAVGHDSLGSFQWSRMVRHRNLDGLSSGTCSGSLDPVATPRKSRCCYPSRGTMQGSIGAGNGSRGTTPSLVVGVSFAYRSRRSMTGTRRTGSSFVVPPGQASTTFIATDAASSAMTTSNPK